tara:strand:- start:222 stop:1043 length:822 start_codon:yes stop_codon:yes gene_type:complete
VTEKNILLGADTDYPTSYSPQLLHPIPRKEGRRALGILDAEPFFGVDLWTAYEVSWLDMRGKPVVAVAELSIPGSTVNLVESKSLKLYLNSLNQERYRSVEEVTRIIERDVSACVVGPILVGIHPGDSYRHMGLGSLPGICLDDLPVAVDTYAPDPSLLGLADGHIIVSESLYSHLLKTNCPVTGQPDWASILIRYSGPAIDREGLLRYLVSFRNHQDFHEQCVERIFTEIRELCQPDKLEVYARYTRRGGLEINPYRSSVQSDPPRVRLSRQ